MATPADTFAQAFQQHQAANFHLAEQLYRQVLQLDPNHADACHLLGVLAYQTGRPDLAAASIGRAVALNPRAEVYHSNLGLAQQALGHLSEAEASFREAVRLNLQFADAYNALSNILRIQGKLDEAIVHGRQALRLNPQFADAHNNVGNALNLQDRVDEAIAHYREALRLRPNFALAYTNLGNALTSLGKFDEAMTATDQALRLQPDSALAHWNRSLLLLLLGDFERGWPEYEWRTAQYKIARRQLPQPLWDGSPLASRRILLYAEQGLGDTIHFVRYAPLVKERGGTVIVECQPSLVRLLATVPGVDQVVTQGSALPEFHVQAPLLSLPGIFRTRLDTIPAKIPYLNVGAALVDKWKTEFSRHAPHDAADVVTRRVRTTLIAIAWQGAPGFRSDRQRSIPLAQFAPIASVPGVQLVSVQTGYGVEQLRHLGEQFPIVDFGSRFNPACFSDAAAVLKNVDLVITVDTAIAHLAGALGVPVWLLLPFVPAWRWLLHRDDSPWYPTMRLFRQGTRGDWDDVFQRVAEEVRVIRSARTETMQ